ncbi:hypothetical protein E4U41_001495 [Claviceps citrina]|nr:hypothetical protein E4U41_001495 [Claviceps citrina]
MELHRRFGWHEICSEPAINFVRVFFVQHACLPQNIRLRRHVTLKIFVKSTSMGQQLDDEMKMYARIRDAAPSHPGRSAVRSVLDTFDIHGPEDSHRCLVHVPLFESVWTFLYRNSIRRLPRQVVAFVLERVFLALDYLHTECQIIHTDIKADNIMFEISDATVLSDFERAELEDPSPRKEVDDGRFIYASRELDMMPKRMGAPVLCDFGSAVVGGVEHVEDVQPNIYRAPEVILQVPWTYSVDIWNVGCMIWDIFEGGSLFSGQDPEFNAYRSRAHLAEMISALGPPPPELVARGQLSHKFFSAEGEFSVPGMKPGRSSLEEVETTLADDEEERADFLRFVRRMLQWEPGKRSSARSLAEDAWIRRQLYD